MTAWATWIRPGPRLSSRPSGRRRSLVVESALGVPRDFERAADEDSGSPRLPRSAHDGRSSCTGASRTWPFGRRSSQKRHWWIRPEPIAAPLLAGHISLEMAGGGEPVETVPRSKEPDGPHCPRSATRRRRQTNRRLTPSGPPAARTAMPSANRRPPMVVARRRDLPAGQGRRDSKPIALPLLRWRPERSGADRTLHRR